MAVKVKDEASVAYADRRLFFGVLFAHGSARVLSKVASAPLERVKVCMQVAVWPAHGSPWQEARNVPGILKQIRHEAGLRALWQGCGAHLLATCVGGAVRLSFLRTMRFQELAIPSGESNYCGVESYARRCMLLYGAGAAALAFAYPFDVAYTCLSADGAKANMAKSRQFRGICHVLQYTVNTHGVTSLYRGFPLCLATAMPFVAIATGVHDLLAPQLMQRRGQQPLVDHKAMQEPFWLVRNGAPAHLYPWNLLVGMASGFAAQAITYPLDTLRRRWQLLCASKLTAANPKQSFYKDCYQQVLKEGGGTTLGALRVAYAGFGPNCLKLLVELNVLCGVYLMINASGNFIW